MALPSSPRSLTPAQGVHLATAVKGAVFGEKHTGARFQVAATVQHCSIATLQPSSRAPALGSSVAGWWSTFTDVLLCISPNSALRDSMTWAMVGAIM